MFDWLKRIFGSKARTAPQQETDFNAQRYHQEIAERSNARAKALNIDPPRPGRKTYQERYDETNRMSISEIEAKIARREKAGQQTGVLHQVLADKLANR